VTVLVVVSLMVAAVLLASTAGAQRMVVVFFAALGIALLAALRVQFLVTFGETVYGAILGALALSGLSGVVLLAAHELVSRAEPVRVFRARRVARSARGAAERAKEDARAAEVRVSELRRASRVYVNAYARERGVASEEAGDRVGSTLTKVIEEEP
jgi:hypothetical protein